MKKLLIVLLLFSCGVSKKEKLSVELNNLKIQLRGCAVKYRAYSTLQVKLYSLKNYDSASKYDDSAAMYLRLYYYYQKKYDSLNTIFLNLK